MLWASVCVCLHSIRIIRCGLTYFGWSTFNFIYINWLILVHIVRWSSKRQKERKRKKRKIAFIMEQRAQRAHTLERNPVLLAWCRLPCQRLCCLVRGKRYVCFCCCHCCCLKSLIRLFAGCVLMRFNRCLQLVEGDQMIFFFNIIYDLTRKQPAMVQHCIDATRLHCWSGVSFHSDVNCRIMARSAHHPCHRTWKSITCSNNLSLWCHATGRIDDSEHSLISIPLETATRMIGTECTQISLHWMLDEHTHTHTSTLI